MERDAEIALYKAKKAISTHTLTWSVTFQPDFTTMLRLDFNSHAHVERDQRRNLYEIWNFHFNSHAHVERDAEPQPFPVPQPYFNSHAHVERDLYSIIW